MITGYLTVKKLVHHKEENISETAISITVNKIKKVYFFVIVVVILQYLYHYITFKSFSATNFIYESFLLYFISPQRFTMLLPHLWYLSSLFLAYLFFPSFI